MADDPLAPSSAPDSLIRLPQGGQLGLNPYAGLFAGLSPEQLQAYNVLADPIFTYLPRYDPPPQLASPTDIPPRRGPASNIDEQANGSDRTILYVSKLHRPALISP
jgi:hypothetical protein